MGLNDLLAYLTVTIREKKDTSNAKAAIQRFSQSLASMQTLNRKSQ